MLQVSSSLPSVGVCPCACPCACACTPSAQPLLPRGVRRERPGERALGGGNLCKLKERNLLVNPKRGRHEAHLRASLQPKVTPGGGELLNGFLSLCSVHSWCFPHSCISETSTFSWPGSRMAQLPKRRMQECIKAPTRSLGVKFAPAFWITLRAKPL